MANENVLLINRDDVMQLTSMSGNVDTTKLLPQIKTAQDVHLQTAIGTKLMNKLQTLVAAGVPYPEPYNTLLKSYVKPTLVFWTMWDFVQFMQYSLSNGGIYKHTSDNAETLTTEEMNALVQRFKDKAIFYAARMDDYLCDSSSDFPEYYGGTSPEMSPKNNDYFHGLQL